MFNVQRSERTETSHCTRTVKVISEAIGSSKEKIVASYKALSTEHFVKFHWLCKTSNGHLICYLWSTSPYESRANNSFVKGYSGTANGYNLENFTRHEQRTYHEEALGRMLSQPVKSLWTILCAWTGIERTYRVPFSWKTSKLPNSYKKLWISPPTNMRGWEICGLCWCPNQCGSDCALVANQVAQTLYEGGPLANSIWSHQIRGLPKLKLYGTWSERVSFSTKHYVDLVSKICNKLFCRLSVFVAAKPRKFFENIFSSPKQSENILAGYKRSENKSENIFGEAKQKSENIGETIWAGLYPIAISNQTYISTSQRFVS